jgi:hypothetical protein
MVWGMIGQLEAKELTNRQAVSASPGDAALGLDPLEITLQEHTKLNARLNIRTSTDLAVIKLAKLLNPAIEARFFKQLIEFRVEHVPIRTGQIHKGNKQVLLLNDFASTKGHRAFLH